MTETLTIEIPDAIYHRLVDTARATNRSLEEIVLRVLEVGSPPSWTDAPKPFQSDLAALDQLNNEALWAIANASMPDNFSNQLEATVEPNSTQPNGLNSEQADTLQLEADRFMLRKAQAAAILRWRGCHVLLP